MSEDKDLRDACYRLSQTIDAIINVGWLAERTVAENAVLVRGPIVSAVLDSPVVQVLVESSTAELRAKVQRVEALAQQMACGPEIDEMHRRYCPGCSRASALLAALADPDDTAHPDTEEGR